MQPVGPVTAQNTLATDTVMKAMSPSRPEAAMSSEQKLFDFVSRVQAEAFGAGGKGAHISNPVALSSEAIGALKAYLERANKLEDMWGRRVKSMSDSDSVLLLPHGGNGATRDLSASLHSGPANAPFDSMTRIEDRQSGQAVDGIESNVTDAELDQVISALSVMLQHGAETAMITSATSSIGKSISTLIRGS